MATLYIALNFHKASIPPPPITKKPLLEVVGDARGSFHKDPMTIG